MECCFFVPTSRRTLLAFCENRSVIKIPLAAFRRAALLLSRTALLFYHIFIAMSIAQMMEPIICRQTCRLAEKTIEKSIVFSMR